MTLESARREDAGLVSRIREGDREAEERLSSKYTLKILYFARRRLSTYEDAEDIRQETMMAVVAAVRDGRIQNPENLGSFIYRVCSNKIVDLLKKSGREVPLDRTDPLHISSMPEQNNGFDQEKRQRLIAAWNTLGLTDRKLLYMKYLRNMRYDDMAKILDLSPQALKKRVQRAKEKIRRRLK
jgi:RNA polymerase sigma-70 factor (ECF subfamily)